MGGQDFLDIVEALGGRRAEDHIVRLGDPGVQIVIADGFAAELLAVTLQTLGVDVEGGDHAASELDHGSAVGPGDIARADHDNIHTIIS